MKFESEKFLLFSALLWVSHSSMFRWMPKLSFDCGNCTGTVCPGSFALPDPPDFVSVVFCWGLDAVSTLREIQRVLVAQRKAVQGLFQGNPILKELHSQLLLANSTMASWVFSYTGVSDQCECQALPEPHQSVGDLLCSLPGPTVLLRSPGRILS